MKQSRKARCPVVNIYGGRDFEGVPTVASTIMPEKSSDESPTPKPTRSELITYSFGNSAVIMGNGLINALQFPIFNMLLGVNPGMIGLIAAVGRLWDAITDPVMGHPQLAPHPRTLRRNPAHP